jgi:mycofactocin precursor
MALDAVSVPQDPSSEADMDDTLATDTLESTEAATAPDELVVEDLLVEDVSIDGMCGVY